MKKIKYLPHDWPLSLRREGHRLLHLLTESLFPLRCPLCRQVLSPRDFPLHRECRSLLHPVHSPHCITCGKPLFQETQLYCSDCLLYPKSFSGGMAGFVYEGACKRAVLSIKYQNRREYIASFAYLLAAKFGERIRRQSFDLLVPVPLHRERLFKRGFNQAELLAKELSAYLSIPVHSTILSRTKETKAQKSLNPEERLFNLSRAITASSLPAGASRILLADDIYTTGSTMEACTRALLSAGAARVSFISICIGPSD